LELLKIGTVARRSGVTVRTLHYYEEIGLLEPRTRSSSGHRLYGREAIERLQQIRALQQLGLSLSDVAALLRGAALSPRQVITNQLVALREQRAAMDRLEAQLLRLKRLLDDEDADDVEAVEVILSTLEAMNMYEKHLTPEQLTKLEEHHRVVEASDHEAWSSVLADLRTEMEAGTPADAPAVKALIERWHEAASAFMPDDEAIHDGVMKAMHEEPEVLAEHGLDADLFAYIGQAMAPGEHATG
jgi:DNA-binding transcriptional MerR regulator